MTTLVHAYQSLARRTATSLGSACRHQAVHRSVISLADQIVVSGTSFCMIVILGRVCLPQELGLYSIGFSLIVTLLGIPDALIWTPYRTSILGMNQEDRRCYSGSTLAHQVLLGAAMAIAISISGGLMWQAGGAKDFGALLMILGPVTLLLSMRECIRRVCFSRLDVTQALAMDVTISALQISGMLVLATFALLSAAGAYLVVGAACMPVVFAWLLVYRPTFSLWRIRIATDFAKNWKLSRWLLASSLVFSLNDMSYPWVLSWLHGTTAVGMLSAANGAILVANPLILGFTNFFGPHAVNVFAKVGFSRLYRQVMIAWFVMAAAMLLFTIASMIWGAPLVALLFGAKYSGQESLIIALAVGQFFEVAAIPFALGLLAVGRGDSLLVTYVVRLTITATIGLWCVQQFGAPGVGYGRALSNFGAVITQWWIFRTLPFTREAKS